MSDFSSKRDKSQESGENTAPKSSLPENNPLLSPLRSPKPETQGGTPPQNLSDPEQKLLEVHTDELQGSHTDELQENLSKDKDRTFSKSSREQNSSDFATFDENDKQTNQTGNKNSLHEDIKKRKKFQSDLNKLALFAYEAEEGAEMLESGEIPFLEEVDKMLQEIDSEIEPILEKESEDFKKQKKQKKTAQDPQFSLQEQEQKDS